MHDFGIELQRVNHKPRVSDAQRVVVVLAAVLFVMILLPMRYLASPRWDVRVVADDGRPIPGINVRLVYENYSAEGQSHEITLTTDENGHALFPPQYERASLLQRLFYTATSAGAGAHASFGRHAFVFAFGGGYEGDAVSGQHVTDWHGSPAALESRIVAKRRSS
jgi:hypothetical protein